MEKSNPLLYWYHHLYLLQLEEYDLARYWKTLYHKWTPLKKRRKELVWTSKAVLVGFVSFVIQLLSILSLTQNIVFVGIIFILSLFVSAVWISIALILVSFLDAFIKELIIVKARRKLMQFTKLTIIGVVGSYGKTTMKEALKQVIGQRYKTVVTPGNINTPLGIANVILNTITPDTEVFIVEMGEYHRGDIKQICQLAQPHVGVVTGINEAHLERMKSIDTTVATIFELVENMDQTGLLVMNGDSILVRERYKQYVGRIKTHLYSKNRPSAIKTQLLGGYAGAVMDGVEAVAHHLHLTPDEVRMGAAAIVPVEHRLQPIQGAHNMLIIDDSYNGNPDGVREAITVLGSYAERRKIYITPGLVEMGHRSKEVHKEIGGLLAPVADRVVLVENSVTPYIREGLIKAGYPESHILKYKTSEDVYSHMSDFARPNDVILFQNDWPDNYV